MTATRRAHARRDPGPSPFFRSELTASTARTTRPSLRRQEPPFLPLPPLEVQPARRHSVRLPSRLARRSARGKEGLAALTAAMIAEGDQGSHV